MSALIAEDHLPQQGPGEEEPERVEEVLGDVPEVVGEVAKKTKADPSLRRLSPEMCTWGRTATREAKGSDDAHACVAHQRARRPAR